MKPKSEKQGEVRSGPAAFGRLCVETSITSIAPVGAHPAAFGRLCVETIDANPMPFVEGTSRLRAAVC